MNWKCFFGHKRNGCKCAVCRKQRNENHSLVKTETPYVETCRICGQKNLYDL